MNLVESDECCTLLTLHDFGGVEYDLYFKASKDTSRYSDFNSFIKVLKTTIKNYDEDFGGLLDDFKDHAICMATTTQFQNDVEEYLTKLGFTSSSPFKKTKHPETTLRLWYIPCQQLVLNLGLDL